MALFLMIYPLGSFAVLQVLIVVLCLKDPRGTLFSYLNGPLLGIFSLNSEVCFLSLFRVAHQSKIDGLG